MASVFLLWLGRYAAQGLVAYLAPRLLVAAGVPLDDWIVQMGGYIAPTAVTTSPEAMFVATLALFIILSAVEARWEPVAGLLARFRPVKQPDQRRTTITFECHIAPHSIIVPVDGRIHIATFTTHPETSAGVNYISTTPGSLHELQGNRPPFGQVYRCSLINYGQSPLFDPEIVFRVDFTSVINHPPSGLGSGELICSVDWPVRLGKIDAGVERPAVFYVWNESSYFAMVKKPTTIAFRPEGETARRVEQLQLLEDRDSFSLSPRVAGDSYEAQHDPSGISGSYPDLRIADSTDFWILYDGPERLKLRGLLRSGKLTTWARRNLSSPTDPILLAPENWDTLDLEYHPAGDRHDLVNQTFLRPAAYVGGVASYYDVHLNKAQLRAVWPERSF
jgi:hypothetical protein